MGRVEPSGHEVSGGTPDLLHEFLTLALDDKLHTCPAAAISEHATILDVGTGTGTWACEIASRSESARVYGIDLHQVEPPQAPSNVVFETVNVMTGFPFNTGTFDFVHSRLLVGGITDWKLYLENLLRITKRGGFVECVEMELCPRSAKGSASPEIVQWIDKMSTLLRGRNLRPDIAGALKEEMRRAGFEDIEETILMVPLADWQEAGPGKEVGRLALEYCKVHIVQWLLQAQIEEGMDRLTAEREAEIVTTQMTDPESQLQLKWHFCVGRKGT